MADTGPLSAEPTRVRFEASLPIHAHASVTAAVSHDIPPTPTGNADAHTLCRRRRRRRPLETDRQDGAVVVNGCRTGADDDDTVVARRPRPRRPRRHCRDNDGIGIVAHLVIVDIGVVVTIGVVWRRRSANNKKYISVYMSKQYQILNPRHLTHVFQARVET